ncbi:MAG: hypothetical protein WAX38_02680 [Minisyncoccia bacterium]
MKKNRIFIPKKIRDALLTVTGVVLVWRGIWVALDSIDHFIMGGSHLITGILGVLVGLAILYHLDHDLEELRSL